ncbi:MAG: acetyl-CoA decarbonylase/synthase complex subunit delta [Planctomycetes bacterium SM23_25]|nr:MAG: acetyl-CoA decarbonylase/synthase complex subunit delta [Planctomycetes bacterium SM23_25]
MPLPPVKDAYSGRVNEMTLGGGDRKSVTIGGAKTIPHGGDREATGHKPVIAIDVLDAAPEEWPPVLAEAYADVLDDPAAWARKAVEEFGAELVCVKFDGIHPDKGDRGAPHAVEVAGKVLDAVDVPIILWGSGNPDKDNAVMPKVSEAAKGQNVLLGTVTEDNYKNLTAISLADGHFLISEAPLDINIAKQVNILVSDMGFPLERMVMFQTTGALGYGLEYAYSLQERQRLAALGGDRLMAMPLICDVGNEAWRAKEAKTSGDDVPEWGDAAQRGPLWEATTAIALLQSGVDIVRMRHPKAVATVQAYIKGLWGDA